VRRPAQSGTSGTRDPFAPSIFCALRGQRRRRKRSPASAAGARSARARVGRLWLTTCLAAVAVIPYLLGFTTESSLVVLGAKAHGRVGTTIRYDLADLPDRGAAADIAEHAAATQSRQQLTSIVMVGYCPGPMGTP